MKRIWIPKVAHHDLTSADKFGERCVVFEEQFSPFMVEAAQNVIRKQFLKTPPMSGDYLLFSGSAVLSALLLQALLSRVGMLTLLIFHARERVYVERNIFADATAEVKEDAHGLQSTGADTGESGR
jgi:hypothetical protein